MHARAFRAFASELALMHARMGACPIHVAERSAYLFVLCVRCIVQESFQEWMHGHQWEQQQRCCDQSNGRATRCRIA